MRVTNLCPRSAETVREKQRTKNMLICLPFVVFPHFWPACPGIPEVISSYAPCVRRASRGSMCWLVSQVGVAPPVPVQGLRRSPSRSFRVSTQPPAPPPGTQTAHPAPAGPGGAWRPDDEGDEAHLHQHVAEHGDVPQRNPSIVELLSPPAFRHLSWHCMSRAG